MIILNPLVLALDIFNLVRLMIVLYFIIARFGQRNCVRSLAAADIYKTILRLYLKQSGGFLKRFINNLLKFLNFLYLHEHYSLEIFNEASFKTLRCVIINKYSFLACYVFDISP